NVAVIAANRPQTSPITVDAASPCPSLVGVPSVNRNRAVSPSAADFDATERKAPTSAAAPSKTSGHQKWNGTADSLNPRPTRTHTAPATTGGGRRFWRVPTAFAISESEPVPYTPVIRLMP